MAYTLSKPARELGKPHSSNRFTGPTVITFMRFTQTIKSAFLSSFCVAAWREKEVLQKRIWHQEKQSKRQASWGSVFPAYPGVGYRSGGPLYLLQKLGGDPRLPEIPRVHALPICGTENRGAEPKKIGLHSAP